MAAIVVQINAPTAFFESPHAELRDEQLQAWREVPATGQVQGVTLYGGRQLVFTRGGRLPWVPVTTAEYGAGRAMAPRPEHSTLSLAKLRATGYEPMEQVEALAEYVSRLGPGGPRTSTNVGRDDSTNVGRGVRSSGDEPRGHDAGHHVARGHR